MLMTLDQHRDARQRCRLGGPAARRVLGFLVSEARSGVAPARSFPCPTVNDPILRSCEGMGSSSECRAPFTRVHAALRMSPPHVTQKVDSAVECGGRVQEGGR